MPNCSWPPISQLLLLKLHFPLSFSTSFPLFFHIFKCDFDEFLSAYFLFKKHINFDFVFIAISIRSIHKLLHLFLIPSVYSRWDGKVVRNWHHGTWHLPRRSEIRHDTSRSSSASFGRLPLLISTTYTMVLLVSHGGTSDGLSLTRCPLAALCFSAPETEKNVEQRRSARVRIYCRPKWFYCCGSVLCERTKTNSIHLNLKRSKSRHKNKKKICINRRRRRHRLFL